ncbi:MAG: hypothetical protein CL902_01165 [Dehalococcoidia bacterium]|nr:hypothetical protein [Dehalococcoidia bacterium]
MERAKKNCYLMLRERGYNVFIQSDGGVFDPAMIAKRGVSQLVVYAFPDGKVGVRDTRRIVADTEAREISHAVVLYPQGITPFAKTDLLKNTTTRFEIFHTDFFLFHLTRHVLVPEHVVLSASEKRKVADRYGIDKLPRISVNDPVARWLDLGRGTIVKIEEASPEGHLVTEYRVVTG